MVFPVSIWAEGEKEIWKVWGAQAKMQAPRQNKRSTYSIFGFSFNFFFFLHVHCLLWVHILSWIHCLLLNSLFVFLLLLFWGWESTVLTCRSAPGLTWTQWLSLLLHCTIKVRKILHSEHFTILFIVTVGK